MVEAIASRIVERLLIQVESATDVIIGKSNLYRHRNTDTRKLYKIVPTHDSISSFWIEKRLQGLLQVSQFLVAIQSIREKKRD